MTKHIKLGKEGERLATDFLERKGYIILERNYRFKKVEIDIIAKKDNILSVVEVKTRSSTYYGNPEAFVKPQQIKNLVAAIDQYIISNDLDMEVQFDIIAIVKEKNETKIEHLENAFYHF